MFMQPLSGQHLRIIDTRQQSQGNYICRAKNRHGKVEISASLKVLLNPNRNRRLQSQRAETNHIESLPQNNYIGHAMPAAHSRVSLQDKAIFDSILPKRDGLEDNDNQHIKHVRTQRGSSFQLHCDAMEQIVSGSPDILYWMKDHRVIRLGQRVQQIVNGSLVVSNTTQADAGMYECVAKRGRERRTIRMQVTMDNHQETQ